MTAPAASVLRVGGMPFARTAVRHTRRMAVAISLAALVAAGLALALCLGTLPLTPAEVVRAIAVDDGSFTRQVVVEWRMPRALAAVAFGAALAASGAVFQSLTRNPLGSPDVIGFGTGAYTGALVATVALGGAAISTGIGALAGGLVTAVVVYLLAWRRGVHGFRLIIVGIGVTGMLTALNTWLLLRARIEVALSGAAWGAGSLSLVSWSELALALPAIAVLLLALAALVPVLRQLELGDDAALAHGVRIEPARLALVLVGVGLVAAATAAAGPVAFVALAAPQLAARLARGPGIPLVASALLGALLLLVADQVAQHLLGGVPVGVVTVVLGGAYLLVLLARGARR